ncbi:hypothetical protein BD413DRAFT_173194 [Trametes elegans]|nr:hypothetical protein BD413DRAFT_173194 [Trametes elegans]
MTYFSPTSCTLAALNRAPGSHTFTLWPNRSLQFASVHRRPHPRTRRRNGLWSARRRLDSNTALVFLSPNTYASGSLTLSNAHVYLTLAQRRCPRLCHWCVTVINLWTAQGWCCRPQAQRNDVDVYLYQSEPAWLQRFSRHLGRKARNAPTSSIAISRNRVAIRNQSGPASHTSLNHLVENVAGVE